MSRSSSSPSGASRRQARRATTADQQGRRGRSSVAQRLPRGRHARPRRRDRRLDHAAGGRLRGPAVLPRPVAAQGRPRADLAVPAQHVVHRDVRRRPRTGRGHPADGLRPQQRPGRRTPTNPSQQVPSFSIISNHCVHLGCPVQANGPSGTKYTGQPKIVEHTAERQGHLRPGASPPATAARATAASTTPRATASPARPCARSTGTRSRSTTAASSSSASTRSRTSSAPARRRRSTSTRTRARASTSTGPSSVLYPIQPPHH